MTRKAKNGRSIGRFLRRALITMLAGVGVLVVTGIVVGLVVSVKQRHASLEEVLADYPRQWEPAWYEDADKPSAISERKVLFRQDLPDNEVLFVHSWKEDGSEIMECVGMVLVKEFQDIFGGWGASHSGASCGSPPAGDASGSSFGESMPWEPKHYYYTGYGVRRGVARVEVELADGSISSVDTVDGSYGLMIRRDEPFHIKRVKYLDASDRVIDSYDG